MKTDVEVNETAVDALQGLIEANIDSRQAFEEAIPRLGDPHLEAQFKEWGAQRSVQAAELQSIVSANGQVPSRAGTIGGALERAWMDVRAALGGGTLAILREIARGEEFVEQQYADALADDCNRAIRDVLIYHRSAVAAVRSHVCRLRDALQAERN